MGAHAANQTSHVPLIKRLIRAMKRRGLWAIRNSTDRGERIVQIVFEKIEDAEKLGDALKAKRTGLYSGWASQRVFGFDQAVVARIEEVLSNTG